MDHMTRRELTIPNDTAHLAQVRKLVLELTTPGLLSANDANLVALAVDEAVANIIEHSSARAAEGQAQQIQVILEADSVRFKAIIRDTGLRFDPTRVAEINIEEHLRLGRRGGLGVFIIRRVMDEISYCFTQGKYNELQLVKYIRPAAGRQPPGARGQEGATTPCP